MDLSRLFIFLSSLLVNCVVVAISIIRTLDLYLNRAVVVNVKNCSLEYDAQKDIDSYNIEYFLSMLVLFVIMIFALLSDDIEREFGFQVTVYQVASIWTA